MKESISDWVRQSRIDVAWLGLERGAEEIRQMERELEELKQSIPLKDRIIFFSDTPDEAREKTTKERLAAKRRELAEHTEKTRRFLTQLQERETDFGLALALERGLVGILMAEQPDQLTAPRKTLTQLLKKLPSEPARPTEVPDPEQAAFALNSGPFTDLKVALKMLLRVSKLVKAGYERTWEGSRRAMVLRPLLLRLVGRCCGAFARNCPGIPFAGELYCSMCPPPDQVPVGATVLREHLFSSTEALLQNLERQVETLVGLDELLELNKKNISTMDRIVFWSDTEAEAREKAWKQQRKDQIRQLRKSWEELLTQVRVGRGEVWSAFLLDTFSPVPKAVERISTPEGRSSWSKKCPVLHREEAVELADYFRRELQRRFQVQGEASQLFEQALMAAGSEQALNRDPLGNPVAIDGETLLRVAAREVEARGLKERFLAAGRTQVKSEDTRRQLRQARSQVSLWDRLNVFSDSEAEKAEKEVRDRHSQEAEQARYLLESAHEGFLEALAEIYPPAQLTFEINRLCQELAMINSECRSFTEEDSEGNRSTYYYCALTGKWEAMQTSARLERSIREHTEGTPYLHQWLEEVGRDFNPVTRWLLRQPFAI